MYFCPLLPQSETGARKNRSRTQDRKCANDGRIRGHIWNKVQWASVEEGFSTAATVMPGFHHSVAVLPFALSPFPLAVAVSVHRCRCRCRMPWLVGVDDWLASYGTTEK